MVKRKVATENPSQGELVYQLKVTLEEIRPSIWRRLVVPAGITLAELHRVLQAVMGWTDSHMHQFHVGEARYGNRSPHFGDDLGYEDEAKITLAGVARKAKTFLYEYDFGDGWMHEIEIEKAQNSEGAIAHAVCTDGARACPPEDIGGPPGYEDFLAGLADPKHEMHEDYIEWIGGSYDPEAFDAKKASARLAQAFPARKKKAESVSRAKSKVQAKPTRAIGEAPVPTVLPFSLEVDDSETARASRTPAAAPDTDDAQPTMVEWRKLYTSAAAFKEIEPWIWMWDKDLFGVQNPEDGQVGYCCVMGALGQHLALAVYRGADGYASWRRIQTEGRKKKVDSELFFIQDCLMASWGDRGGLEHSDLQVIKDLGLKFRGTLAWPLFRSHLPGYFPWRLTGKEARFLTCALEQARDVALRLEKDPKLLVPKGDTILVRVSSDGKEGLHWEDQWLPPEPAPPPPLADEPLDEVRLKQIAKKCEKVDGVWQVDRFHMPTPVSDKSRPFFPVLFLAVDPAFGLVVGQGMNHPNDGLCVLRGHLLDAMETTGAIPRELYIRRTELLEPLRPIAECLGLVIRLTKGLKELDSVRRELDRLLQRVP